MRRSILAAIDFEALEHRRTECGSGGRHSGTRIVAARVGDRGDRVGEHDAGIGEQPAPVARMMAALAQIDDQIDRD